MLSEMCANKLLQSSGYGRGTKYHVYGINLAGYAGNLASSASNLATSEGNNLANLDTSDENLATSPTENLASSKKKRYSKVEVQQLILNFCSEWRTIEDISIFLDRDKSYIRNEILPMLAEKLEKLFENIPNHPRQKYRVKK
jgi:hypothetical protein